MLYRRDRCPGGTWFFTVNLADRRTDLLVRHIQCLRAAFRTVRSDHPFRIEAMVVLPEHLHAVWRLPPGDSDYATRWRLIKHRFSRSVVARAHISGQRQRHAGTTFWQKRYWEHRIRDARDFETHVDYIHFNPVKHGYVGRPVDWPHSSIHRYIRAGALHPEWGGDVRPATGTFGERRDDDAATAGLHHADPADPRGGG